MTEFTLYAYTFPSRAERILWALREFNCSYTLVRLNPFQHDAKMAEFLRLNPSRKVPVLVHGDEALTESLAIMEYLNDISDGLKLIPSEPKAAYQYRKIIHYGLTEIEPYLWIADQSSRLKTLYSWPQGTYESAILQVKDNIKVALQWAEAGDYIIDDEFTLADIYFYHLITWAIQHKIECSSTVHEYLKLLQARSAFPGDLSSN